MHRITFYALAFLILVPLASLHAADIVNLRCEYRNNPLGIDVARPRLSWEIEERNQRPEARNLKQSAYQLLVASSEELLAKDQGDLWNSGKVGTDQTVNIEYARQNTCLAPEMLLEGSLMV